MIIPEAALGQKWWGDQAVYLPLALYAFGKSEEARYNLESLVV